MAIIDLPDERRRARPAPRWTRSSRRPRPAAAAATSRPLTLYEDALQVLPQHTEARRELAMVQMELGQTAAAKQNLIRVLQLDPKDAWAYLILGNLYFKHEHDRARPNATTPPPPTWRPTTPTCSTPTAACWLERGRYDEAKELFERAIAASPSIPIPTLAWPWSPQARRRRRGPGRAGAHV